MPLVVNIIIVCMFQQFRWHRYLYYVLNVLFMLYIADASLNYPCTLLKPSVIKPRYVTISKRWKL